jgi:hypothetical protein
MRTARMLEAERRQVVWGSVVMGTKEDESSTGHIWAGGYYHLTVRSHLACFETYEPFISSTFNFFSGRSKHRILNQWIRGHGYTKSTFLKYYLTTASA